MISPSEINLLDLPSAPLGNRSQLPIASCVYFAIDSFGIVQYIGRTINLNQRWVQHHRHNQLLSMGEVRISYLFADVDLLPSIEEAMIQWFAPPLNGSAVLKVNDKGQRFTFTIEPDLYEPLKVQAQTERRSVGSLLNWLIAKHLQESQGIAIEPSIQHGGDRRSKNDGGEAND